jgi:hypothetical protein
MRDIEVNALPQTWSCQENRGVMLTMHPPMPDDGFKRQANKRIKGVSACVPVVGGWLRMVLYAQSL